MENTRLWTKNFIAIVMTNALLFGGFHILLPTLPLYAAAHGATGSQIGIITGIFGFSAIFIRFFTDFGQEKFGKKKCLYLGLLISVLCTVGYNFFYSVNEMIAIRLFHGFGFGLTTTFAAAIAADIIPRSRMGEGIGYFGLGSTLAMALAPAAGLWLMNGSGSASMFAVAAIASALAFLTTSASKPSAVAVPKEAKAKLSLRDRLLERGTAIPALLTVLFGMSYGSVNTFVSMMANQAHIENAGAFFIVGTICIFLSRPIGGRIFDAKGPAWIMVPGSALFFIALILLMHATSLPMLLGVSVLYGFGGGLLLPALLTWMLNLVSSDRRSGASATFYNMLDVGTSAGAIGLGAAAETIGYIDMYRYSAAAMALFFIIFVLYMIRTPKVQTQEDNA